MTRVLAIDPGTTDSAFVVTDGSKLFDFGKIPNEELLWKIHDGYFGELPAYIEMIASYGMPVGAEVFSTCVWIGKFIQAFYPACNPRLIYRKDVKAVLCGAHPKANDATVRQALIDRFGPGKEKAVGLKRTPGPLYGVTGDVWAALGIAITALELSPS